MPVFLLSKDSTALPPPYFAREDGLLAVGGDLCRKRLLKAYKMGIFPWFSKGDPILWWSPDPRLVLYTHEFHVSRSLKKLLRKNVFQVTFDEAFKDVITSCAQIRSPKRQGTWIVPEMIDAYCDLHAAGYAHSVEVWKKSRLIGGLYGVATGRFFSGESMFSLVSNASKVALVYLIRQLKKLSFHCIDCQVKTDHLLRFGAREIPRARFLKELADAQRHPTLRGPWKSLLLPDRKR
jgi:leucyl/phenylalanyl-tRNA--protein transferase